MRHTDHDHASAVSRTSLYTSIIQNLTVVYLATQLYDDDDDDDDGDGDDDDDDSDYADDEERREKQENDTDEERQDSNSESAISWMDHSLENHIYSNSDYLDEVDAERFSDPVVDNPQNSQQEDFPNNDWLETDMALGSEDENVIQLCEYSDK